MSRDWWNSRHSRRSIFESGRALHDAGVHRGVQQGIGAGGKSIVLADSYVDDLDDGDTIIYIWEGRRDPSTGRQIADQSFMKGNLSLMKNFNSFRMTGKTMLPDYSENFTVRR